jgi:hypothetical protein
MVTEAREESVPQHRLRAAADFLCGLADHHQRPAPALPVVGQRGRGTDPRGHVNVVAARVHHRHRLTRGVLPRRLTREGEPRLLFDRERVELGAQHDGRAGAVLEDAHDAGPSDARRDLEACSLQSLRHLRGGRRFLKRKLGVRVKVFVERLEDRPERLGPRGHEHEQCQRRGKTGGAAHGFPPRPPGA